MPKTKKRRKYVEVYDKQGKKIGKVDAKLFVEESGMKPLRVYILGDEDHETGEEW